MRNLDIVNMKNSIKGRKSKILKLFLCFLLLGVSYSFANNNNYSPAQNSLGEREQ